MPDKQTSIESLFCAALAIESTEQRAAFLDESCGADRDLRQQLEELLQAHISGGSFLDRPALDLELIFAPDAAGQNLAEVLEAGLSPGFGNDHTIVIDNVGHSVLKSFGKTIDVPRVALRETADEGAGPIARPKSPEMPDRGSDSRYQLHGEIARGGMGAILKGRDTDLGRELAIKVLLEAHKDKREVVQRFIEEAQIGGQLQHPGIAPVYELGQFADLRPFFSMKLVKGETFSKLLAKRKNAAEDRGKFLGIFEQICQTMAYVHSRGVIHRDLKPANIMVGSFGEVQVMDWGLAKVLPAGGVADEKHARDKQHGKSIIQTLRSGIGSDRPVSIGTVGSQTQMGSVMGTPAYMPPEQALGGNRPSRRAVGRVRSGGDLVRDPDRRTSVCGRGWHAGLSSGGSWQAGRLLRATRREWSRPRTDRLDETLPGTGTRRATARCRRARRARLGSPGIGRNAAAEIGDRMRHRSRAGGEALQTAKEHEAAARAERQARRLQMGLAVVVVCVTTIAGIAAAWTAMVQTRLKQEAVLAEQKAGAAREAESKQRELAEAARGRAETEKARADVTLADMQTLRGLQAGEDGDAAIAALWFANAALTTPHDPARTAANRLRARNWLNDAIVPVAMLKLPEGNLERVSFQPAGDLALTLNNHKLRLWDLARRAGPGVERDTQ